MPGKTEKIAISVGSIALGFFSLLLFSCSSVDRGGSGKNQGKGLPWVSKKKADYVDFVCGRRLDGSIFGMESVEIFLRNASVPLSYWNKHGWDIKGLTFEAKTDKDGKFEIPGLPFGKYSVLVIPPPKYSDFCGIQETFFRFPEETGANEYFSHLHNWYLNQAHVLHFLVVDGETGKPVKGVKASGLYSELDGERVFRWDWRRAEVALKENEAYDDPLFVSEGKFSVRLSHNSRGKGFLRFLQSIVLTAPGYEWKEIKGDWFQALARYGKKPWVVKMTPKKEKK